MVGLVGRSPCSSRKCERENRSTLLESLVGAQVFVIVYVHIEYRPGSVEQRACAHFKDRPAVVVGLIPQSMAYVALVCW